jgi:single-strand DNA-binding protein
MSVNKAILIGNLGADPEVRYMPSGQPVCNFNLATNEQWTDREGQRQERTEWHRVVVFGRQAELCKEYLSKGRQAYIEGRIQTREWEDRDGNRRWTTEVVAQIVRFLGRRGGGGGGASMGGRTMDGPQPAGPEDLAPEQPSSQAPSEAPSVGASETFDDDDIPF